MKESVKRTASRDETEMVGVQGTTEAEPSSRQPRKRCRKAKVVEASSDQTQTGGRMDGVVEASSHQTKKRGRKATLTPEELKARKTVRDSNRYQNMRDAVQENKEIKPQMEILKNETAELRVELGKINSERLPAIAEHLTTVTEQLEIVKNDFKKMESPFEKFVQKEVKENDRVIDLDHYYLGRMENRSSEGIPNGEDLLTDLEYPLGTFDLVGMPRQEILPELEKIRNSIEELKRENERRYEELKRENEELKRENKMLNSRITARET